MAQKSQGARLQVATASLSTKTITAITAASPPVVSSAAHGLTAGTIVVLSGIVGMVELNNRAFVVSNPVTGTFELKGVDATLYTAYASGGIATPKTMTDIGEINGIPNLFDGEAGDIDSTHLRSTAKESFPGLQDFGGAAFSLFIPATADVGQTRLRTLKQGQLIDAFALLLPSGQIAAFMAYVKKFSAGLAGPDSVVTGDVSLKHASEPAFFA